MTILSSKLLLIGLCLTFSAISQVSEPVFIGEAYRMNNDSTVVSLDKELTFFTAGASLTANSWNALSVEIPGRMAKTRFTSSELLKVIVRAFDNNYDPGVVISVYKFKTRRNSRRVVLSEDNSGTLLKSGFNTKNLVQFDGKKMGKSSYLIELKNLVPGEYGIIVANPGQPNNTRAIILCFGID